ncbi:hypothetical protein SEA_LEONARD_82 [Gordonia phage Leonard]|uniref:Uncharacterized protein n=2 Tax=Leonardvirus TaxID=2948800 RepID=A0A649VMN4_9CAUD|nr:hypothetical protein J1769_gp82 [Gordonia phage Leonard]QGJ93444.1 hypothetical protein SEA_LEONARD_82 [Gordonia phage Leonard]
MEGETMTTEPRTIVLPDQREVVVIYGHHTHPNLEQPVDVTDIDPLPPPGTVVIGRLDQAPARLAENITACRIRASSIDHDGYLYEREYALPMSLDGLEWAANHLIAALVAAMLDTIPAHTMRGHTA